MTEKKSKIPNIFIFDVENAPTKGAIWGMFKQYISLSQLMEEWYMLSWAGKWLGDVKIYGDLLTPQEAKNSNDKRIMETLWRFIDAADVLIGHNIKFFDIRKANARFIKYGFSPPSPYQMVDTRTEASKNFAFTSNKLDYLCKELDIDRKMETGGMETWFGCMKGIKKDLERMFKYNKHDVKITEELYLKLRPFIKSHPNIGLLLDGNEEKCYKCGSTNLHWQKDKFYYTTLNAYPIYRCADCSSIGRSRTSALSKNQSKLITSPIAR